MEAITGHSSSVFRPSPLPLKAHMQQPPTFGLYLLWPNGRPSQLLLSTCVNLARSSVSQRTVPRSLQNSVDYRRVGKISDFQKPIHCYVLEKGRITRNKMWPIGIAPLPMTLSDIEGHFSF